MKQIAKTGIAILATLLLLIPSFAFADGDYEEGDGWIYQDGVLKITDNCGLDNFLFYEEVLVSDPNPKHTVSDVDHVIIGKDVTDIELNDYIYNYNPSNTTVEDGNQDFIIDNGWVVNKATNTLFGAANVQQNTTRTVIDDIPAYIEHIGMYAVTNCNALKEITIPEGVVSIGEFSFSGCNHLESITLPSKTTLIGVGAFSECIALTHVDFGDKIDYIGAAAFDECVHLETPPFQNMQLDTIYGNSFWGCSTIQTVEFPATLRLVEDQAFAMCDLLSTLIFNSDQLIIENGAFGYCENVRKLIFAKGKPASIGDSLFCEDDKTPDGKSFIKRLYDPNGKIIPYPTLYYTAAYADEWAPNGETEWSGYAIEEISQDELNAILAEARGEPVPTPTAAAEPTALPTVSPQPVVADSGTPFVVPLLAGLIVLAGAAAVAVGVSRKRKGKKTES